MATNKEKKQPQIILEKKTHLFVFFYPMLFLIMGIYYSFSIQKSNIIFIILPIFYCLLIYFFSYYGKKIILTDKKVYIYVRKKKIISWSLVDDLVYVGYEPNKFTRFFGWGTLTIINKDKVIYSYNYLTNVVDIYEKIMQTYENNMIAIDPTYEKTFLTKDAEIDSFDN